MQRQTLKNESYSKTKNIYLKKVNRCEDIESVKILEQWIIAYSTMSKQQIILKKTPSQQ